MIKFCGLAIILIAAWLISRDEVQVGSVRSDDSGLNLVPAQHKALVFLGVVAFLLLAGCGSSEGVRVLSAGVTLPHKPDADFQCEDEPDPTLVRTDEDDAHYKNSLRHAWKDCRNKLGGAGRIWRESEAAQSRAIPPKGDVK